VQNTPYGLAPPTTGYTPQTSRRGSAARGQSPASIDKAVEAIRNADNEDEKSKAEDKLTKLLRQYFDEDMQHRQEELARIEARTKKLRELLELRRTKKGEIIELQIKVFLNEAEGLGFFNDSPAASSLGPQQRLWADRVVRSYPQLYAPTPVYVPETPLPSSLSPADEASPGTSPRPADDHPFGRN
jgi:hypothetical protein